MPTDGCAKSTDPSLNSLFTNAHVRQWLFLPRNKRLVHQEYNQLKFFSKINTNVTSSQKKMKKKITKFYSKTR